MSRTSADNATTKPPIPADWNGEPRFAVFVIPSLQSIPLPHGSTFGLWRREEVDWLRGVKHQVTPETPLLPQDQEMNGFNFVSIKVWRLPEKLKFPMEPIERATDVACAIIPDMPPPRGQHRESAERILESEESFLTVFEAVTPLIAVWCGGQVDVDRTIDDAFDRCVENLSELIRAYVIISNDVRVTPPTRISMSPLVPWTTRNPQASNWGGLGLYLPNPGQHIWPTPTGTIDRDDLDSVMTVISRMNQHDPIMVFAEHARACRRAYWMHGDHAATVIEVNISSEVLFDAVLLMMAWEEGTSPEEAAEWFDQGLSKRLRTYYSPRLGGNWNTRDGKSVIGRWAERVYQVRNRVAHRGYRPSEREAQASLSTMDKVEAFVKGRIAANRSTYPRTTLLVVGKPGLEKLGLYAGKIKRFVETAAPSEPNWLASYDEWVQAFEAHRARA